MKTNLRVLMLEDSEQDADLIKSLLTTEGFNVEAVRTDSESAFSAALAEGGFDLILSDFTLPGYSGASALVLARERCPEVPYLFISGTIGEEQAVESLKCGATDFVLKHNLNRLALAVRRALREADDRRAKAAAEQALRDLNADLERRVRERTADLEEANQELDAFARSVSHDLRAPLGTIATYVQFTIDEHGPRMSREVRDAFDCIAKEVGGMNRLIDDMLRLSRVTRWELTWQQVDLGAEAQTVVSELRRQHPARTVEVIIAPGLMVQADVGLVRIALENLLSNAWKFTSKRADARIEVGAVQKEGRPVYLVRDNGAGFDLKRAGKLFAAFHRLHSQADFPGTGVGLATVHRVVRKHGGTIWAESAPNQGATFYFTW